MCLIDEGGQGMIINQLQGSLLTYKLSELLAEQSTPALVITPDNYTAQVFEEAVNFFDKSICTHHFPDYETLPYDLLSPHQSVISDRIKTLCVLQENQKQVIFASITSLLNRLPPTEFLGQQHLSITVGDTLDQKAFRETLRKKGYRMTQNVMEHGECAIRGSIIDIYPMGSELPLRIDLFDDEIDSIRTFDIDSQCSIDKIPGIQLLPAYEFPTDEDGIRQFRRNYREVFTGNPRSQSVYNDVSDGIMPSGIEYYLPLFFQTTSDIFDYLHEDTKIYLINDCAQSARDFGIDLKKRHESRQGDLTRPILPPHTLYLDEPTFFNKVKQFQSTLLNQEKKSKNNIASQTPPNLLINRQSQTPFAALTQFINDNDDKHIIIAAESAGRREVLLDLCHKADLSPVVLKDWLNFKRAKPQLSLIECPLTEGLVFDSENLAIIVEAQLFDIQHVKQRKRKRVDPDVVVKDLTELKVGSPVVHIEHGIGRYQGLTFINENEFLMLTYRDNAKLYVPVTSLHLISRYTSGHEETAHIHQLGSSRWQKEKKKALEDIKDVASELLDIYSERQAQQGLSFNKPNDDYQLFCQQFPFEETDDQINAINDIINDMCQSKPMERLICGDVGFGKTEVAMRAAFLSVQSNYQVCILVPTTLLCEQHYQNLLDRFSEFPVNISLLSRFRSKKEVDQALAECENGKIDILVGTHKIFSKQLKFKQLGLLIIDEEHRFGVKQKEHIKSIKTNVDTLTLTATPIPRTLNMSMSGLHDISIIATPPAKRLAIKTFHYEKSPVVIKDAITREIMRGGQVFYLHNDVKTMENTLHHLQELIPEAKIAIAHGQMRERQLEKIMSDFYHHQFNVLLCSTIIETGIDIPTANTIVIERADKFGLAQLHQLRGRVGRSHQQAYAYLLTPTKKAMTKDALKRLEAIMSMEDLGAGFMLATHDLEIRGAGELLGEEQSGNMQSIGFSLYMELLDKAVKAIKAGKSPSLHQSLQEGPEIQLSLPSIIPDDYMPDVHLRLTFYKRIANAETNEELESLQVEMIDRFGLLPESTKQLFAITECKQLANKIAAKQIKSDGDKLLLDFYDENPIPPELIIHLIQIHSKHYKLANATRLVYQLKNKDKLISELSSVLHMLFSKQCLACGG